MLALNNLGEENIDFICESLKNRCLEIWTLELVGLCIKDGLSGESSISRN